MHIEVSNGYISYLVCNCLLGVLPPFPLCDVCVGVLDIMHVVGGGKGAIDAQRHSRDCASRPSRVAECRQRHVRKNRTCRRLVPKTEYHVEGAKTAPWGNGKRGHYIYHMAMSSVYTEWHR